jgi:hypothetical protein
MRARVTPGSLTPAQYRARSAGAAGIVTLLSIASVAATAIAAQPGAPTLAFVVCALLAVAFIILGNAAVGIAHMFAFTPKARDVELTCHKGMVEGPGFRLRAADIVGASTARLGTRGYLLSVETASGGIPHAIELETRAELDEVRRALGVARDGTRGLRWATGRPPRFWAGLGVAIASLALSPLGMFVVWILPFFASPSSVGAAQVVLLPHGIRWREGPHAMEVHFADVASVSASVAGLLVQRRSGPVALIPTGSLPAAHQAFLVAQIQNAAERARHVDDDARGILRRGAEGEAQWLARIDSLRDAGYRSAGVDHGELWRIAADPDASLEERIAAGRLLTRAETPEGRVRVAATLADLPMDEASVQEAISEDAERALTALRRRTVGAP